MDLKDGNIDSISGDFESLSGDAISESNDSSLNTSMKSNFIDPSMVSCETSSDEESVSKRTLSSSEYDSDEEILQLPKQKKLCLNGFAQLHPVENDIHVPISSNGRKKSSDRLKKKNENIDSISDEFEVLSSDDISVYNESLNTSLKSNFIDAAMVSSDEESLTEYVPSSSEYDSDNDIFQLPNQEKLSLGNFAQIHPVKKNSHLTINSNGKKKRVDRLKKKKPRRPCLYCGKFQSQLSRHLLKVHSDQPQVKAISCLPAAKRNFELGLLRKQGIYKENIKLIKDNRKVIPERNQGDCRKVKLCSNCKAFISANTFFKHRNKCKGNGNDVTGLSLNCITEGALDDLKFTEILSRFQDDERGRQCCQDSMIKTVGNSLFQRHKRKINKTTEIRKSIMTSMRTLAALYLEFKSCTTRAGIHEVTSECMLKRRYFNFLEEAIASLTSNENGSIKPGLKLSIGNLLKTSIKVMKGTYLIQQDDKKAESVDKFEAVLRLRWTRNFGDAEYESLKARQSKLRLPSHLPDEGELQKVRDYTLSSIRCILSIGNAHWSCPLYISLRNLLISRLTLFNARRGGEPSRLMVQDWNDAKADKWIDKQHSTSLNDDEKMTMENFKIMYQGGKGSNHLVPVLVPPDCAEGIEILADADIRILCRVSPNNKFLFPSTGQSLDHASGWHCTKEIAMAAGVRGNITATQMRHRAATLYAALDVSENQREAFFRHMGHSAEVNKTVYQCPLAVQEVTEVGKYLADIDGLKLNRNCTVTEENPPEGEDDEKFKNISAGKRIFAVDSSSSEEETFSQEKPSKQKCYRKKVRSYLQWKQCDTKSVCQYFSFDIEDISEAHKGSLPGKERIEKFLEENPSVLSEMQMNERIKKIHSKIFNERKKYRNKIRRRIELYE